MAVITAVDLTVQQVDIQTARNWSSWKDPFVPLYPPIGVWLVCPHKIWV